MRTIEEIKKDQSALFQVTKFFSEKAEQLHAELKEAEKAERRSRQWELLLDAGSGVDISFGNKVIRANRDDVSAKALGEFLLEFLNTNDIHPRRCIQVTWNEIGSDLFHAHEFPKLCEELRAYLKDYKA